MLRSQNKIATIAISILVSLMVLQAILHSTKKISHSKETTVRPSGFPAILTVPESADEIRYTNPSNAKVAAYDIRFHMNESYPAEKTLSFIEMNLSSHRWHKLGRSLLNPELDFILYRKWYPNRDKSGEIVWRYTEDWLSENDESITVFLFFPTGLIVSDNNHTSQEKEEVKKTLLKVNNLSVDIGLFEPNSWVRPFIQKYKKLYPEDNGDGNK